MADSNFTEKPLLEKIQDLLERKPGTYDVAFCVGKENKIVKALKVILKASSNFLEKEFEEKWEVAVIKEGDGIPLPDFDPIAFELFVKLTTLDTWSLEILKTLNLPPNQILNLLSICRRFEMTKAVENLEKILATFLQSFGDYKDTDDILQLSQPNLKFVLVSDDIGIKELDVFHAAMRWAEFQCMQLKVEPTQDRIRAALGDCLFEIRFPIMTSADFTETAESKDILTADETIGIYRFIGLEATKQFAFDAKKFPFKTATRKQEKTEESEPNLETFSSEALVPPGVSTLSLTRGCQIVENPPFVCDGSLKQHFFACGEKTTVYGLGFLGPIENDGFYDVKVQITGIEDYVEYNYGELEKRIFAEKGKTFYFIFDDPIELDEDHYGEWNQSYTIDYFLKGANTFACARALYTPFVDPQENTTFRLQWRWNQLSEILFKLG